ncbi:MAG: proline--tRNA ligase [Erysipelotrichaceae bacterium]|nr:proline--tRNA ligase [Erysipelotrichaceae bacterium]
MKLKDAYFFTLREDAKDEDSVSGNLLVKAGFIKKVSGGVYMMLPFGYRVQAKVEEIIRRRMNETGAIEVKMPALIAADYYEKSGRLKNFGPDLFKLKDRTGKDMVLGPTHEELFAVAAKSVISSYKDMPFNIYQIQSKYRDEPRARYGLIRVKEFVMKDAYSFDRDEAGLDVSYKKMFDAYKKIFDDIGLDYRIVKADTGMMGGLLSEEFQAVSEIGEDVLVHCDCGYSSNLEIATRHKGEPSTEERKAIEEIPTPNVRTIEELCAFLNKDPRDFVKTMIYMVSGRPCAVVVRGNREVCETKLKKFLRSDDIALADAEVVEKVTGARVGFAGPVGLRIPVILDEEVTEMRNFIVGANKDDTHLINVNPEDFKPAAVIDLKEVQEGDRCPICGQPLKFAKGIEVGNTFKLGTKYSKALDLTYLDQNNQTQDVWMGSYGIGLGRCIAAVVEQNHDKKGILWPEAIAPYKVIIVLINGKDETQATVAEQIYNKLTENGVEVLLDDRDVRAGVKFADSELIGIPYRITVGRGAKDNLVEVNKRNSDVKEEMSVEEAIAYLSK